MSNAGGRGRAGRRRPCGASRAFADNTATAGRLAKRVGFNGYGGANFAMGALGQRLAKGFAIVNPDYTPATRHDGSPMWSHVVATGKVGDDNLFWWTLRPGLDSAAP